MSAAARFFGSAGELRRWLAAHHASQRELLVGFFKKGSGRKGITYPEALDEALCFGWIDGVRKGLDAESYTIRFTPRKPRSHWSQVNIRRVRELMEGRRMRPPGRAAFEGRDQTRTRLYAYEREAAHFETRQAKAFKANRRAWTFFEAQPPSYRRVVTFWVTSAKKEETRERRLRALIASCARGQRVPQFTLEPRKAEQQ